MRIGEVRCNRANLVLTTHQKLPNKKYVRLGCNFRGKTMKDKEVSLKGGTG